MPQNKDCLSKKVVNLHIIIDIPSNLTGVHIEIKIESRKEDFSNIPTSSALLKHEVKFTGKKRKRTGYMPQEEKLLEKIERRTLTISNLEKTKNSLTWKNKKLTQINTQLTKGLLGLPQQDNPVVFSQIPEQSAQKQKQLSLR